MLSRSFSALLALQIASALAFAAEAGHAMPQADVGGPSEPDGYYLDPECGPTRFAPEYERWFGRSRRPARYGRTALWLGGVLAVGTSYYWIVSDPNKQDWDYI